MSRHSKSSKTDNAPYVVIAGAAGFIGSHLAESLINSGAKVIGLDNISTGSLQRLSQIKKHPRFEFIELDLNQPLPDSLLKKPITHVVNTIGQDAHTPDKIATLSSLISGSFATKNLLDLAVATGSTFLMTSSIYLYQGLVSSTNLQHYFGSDAQQRATYSLLEAKRYAEALVEMYARQYHLDVRIARLSMVYGPKMDIFDQSSIDQLFLQAIQQQDLVVEEDGSQEFYLTYVSDVVYGLSRLLFAQGSQYSQTIYSLVNPEKYSLLSLAYALRSQLPATKEVRFLGGQPEDYPNPPTLNIERTRVDLQWDAITTLTQGIKSTLEYFQQNPPATTQHPQLKPKQLNILPAIPTASSVKLNNSSPATQDRQPAKESQVTPPSNSDSTAPSSPDQSKLAAEDQAASPKPNSTKLPFRANSSQQLLDIHHQKDASPPPSAPPSGSVKYWFLRIGLAFILIVIYVLLIQPLFHSVISSTYASIQIKQGLQQLKSANFAQAQQSFSQSSQALATASQQWHRLQPASQAIHTDMLYQEVDQILSSASSASQSLTTLSRAAQPWPTQVKQFVQAVGGQTQKPSDQTKQQVEQLIAQTQTHIAEAQDQLSQSLYALNSNPSQTRVAGATSSQAVPDQSEQGIGWQIKQKLRHQLIQGQLALTQVEQLLEVAPQLVGLQKSTRYLIMLQNSNELRATGGFTGSLIELEMDRGVVANFKVDDIYNPDGQLKEKSDPHDPIPQKAANHTIPLRDANWYPDVPTSAKNTSQLYQKATGRHIDGLAYITLNAIKPILQQVGPLYLPAYQKQVTSSNFPLLAQTYSNTNYQAGSSNKKDFLGVVFDQLIHQSTSSQNLQSLVSALHRGLETQEIQLYSSKPAITALINQYDWSGRTKTADGDYLRVIDSNIGANKSNYDITRSTSYQINLDRQGNLSAIATINWQHHGQSATWPSGDYKNYLRLYAPLGSTLTKSTGLKKDKVEKYTENGKQVFAGYITVPVNSTAQVKIEYKLPPQLNIFEQNYHYSLLWQKQSGILQEPLTVKFNTPVYLTHTNQIPTWQQTPSHDQTFTTTLQPIK